MRMACLILAYSAAPVLKFAAPFYKAAGWDIFVHVDSKVDLGTYSAELEESAELCHFVADPLQVFWGGYSMIEAEIKLIKAAREIGPYDKYLLLSDDSFPALPGSALVQHFDNEEDQVTIVPQRESSPFYLRYQAFVCYDHEATAARGISRTSGNPVARVIDEGFEQRIAEIGLLRKRGKKKLEVYYGSQFWALTSKTVDLILHVVANDLHLQKSFEYSALPDETMFQSILGNYTHTTQIQTGPVYVDFSTGGPRVIERVEDIPRDLQQPHAFIRKFSPNDRTFLSKIALRLEAGRTILDTLPGSSGGVQMIVDQAGRAHATIRLAAPAAKDAGPCWQGIESFWGRQYRWTALSRVKWTMQTNIATPGTVRFVLTTVIASGKEWMQGCKLAFNGKVVPVDIVGGELTAEFEHADLRAVEVELQTPELTSPSETTGSHDTRRLGLSVAL